MLLSRFKLLFSAILLALVTTSVQAQEALAPEQKIKARIEKLTNGAKMSPVRPSAIDGLYKVDIVGGPSLLVSEDASHVVMGDAYELTDAGLVPVQDPFMVKKRKEFIASLERDDTIRFTPEGETKEVAYVFTDVECGYCRRLHSQMKGYTERGRKKPGYNDLGIEIRYLAYPRAGVNSPSAAKLESAWCADNPAKALDKLKNLQSIEPASCDASPVARHFHKGQQLGVTGTPAIMLPDGRLLVGYKPPQQLLNAIQNGR